MSAINNAITTRPGHREIITTVLLSMAERPAV
jgi:hypothetical protein